MTRFASPAPHRSRCSRGLVHGPLVLAAAAAVACSGDDAPVGVERLPNLLHSDAAGPAIVQVDSVLLEETEFYLGRPYSLSADTVDGSFLVADGYLGRMLRFGRDGRFVRSYGRPGQGPGEFAGLGRGLILNDSVVVGRDNRRNLLTRFSREGTHLGSTR